MDKRGQISIYFIIGLVLVIIIIFLFYLRSIYIQEGAERENYYTINIAR